MTLFRFEVEVESDVQLPDPDEFDRDPYETARELAQCAAYDGHRDASRTDGFADCTGDARVVSVTSLD